jgi:hypothetical protein
MSLNGNTLSFTRITSFYIRIRMSSRSMTMGTNDFSGYLELSSALIPLLLLPFPLRRKGPPRLSEEGRAEKTHLYSPSSIHIRQTNFQIRQHPWSSLFLLLSTSSKESCEWIITTSLFSSFMLFETFFSVSIVYLSCLSLAPRINIC